MFIIIVSQKQNHAMQNSVKFLHNANVCDHFCSQNLGIFKYDIINSFINLKMSVYVKAQH